MLYGARKKAAGIDERDGAELMKEDGRRRQTEELSNQTG